MEKQQKAYQTEMSVLDIFKLDTGVQIESQRFIIEPSPDSIEMFFYNTYSGLLHQNIVLVDTSACYGEGVKGLKDYPDYLIIDGQHRIKFIQQILTDEWKIDGRYFSSLVQSVKDEFTNTKLPVRIITSLTTNDDEGKKPLSSIFIANNSGNAVSTQDLLTMMDSDTSRWIVNMANTNRDTLSALYGEKNHNRTHDKQLRIKLQKIFSTKLKDQNLLNNNKKQGYDYGKHSGQIFYSHRNRIDADKQKWADYLIEWLECSANAVPNSSKRKHAGNGAYLLHTLRSMGWNHVFEIDELFSHYIEWESPIAKSNKMIVSKLKHMDYKTAIGNVGKRYDTFRQHLFTDYVEKYATEFAAKGWIG